MVKKIYPKEGESKNAVVKRFTFKYLYFELSIKVQKKREEQGLGFSVACFLNQFPIKKMKVCSMPCDD